jgi:hypothetical protein
MSTMDDCPSGGIPTPTITQIPAAEAGSGTSQNSPVSTTRPAKRGFLPNIRVTPAGRSPG